MLLLIRYRIVTQYCQFHIYIPLCFYLYSIHLNAGRGDDTFTFHYASTYTIKAAIKSGQIIEFTFHYASTYTKAPLQEYPDREIIYIPLCFYLYQSPAARISWSGDNLHSTMLLLILRLYFDICFSDMYLHSTMLLLIRNPIMNMITTRSYLHSTMLLLIPGVRPLLCCGIAFTFHYASTYTCSADTASQKYSNLHSTMLLLILHSKYLGWWT